jgi:haloacetate dehalogenase
LAKEFTVVAPDLRGYGDSSQPATVPDHRTYGKRAMASDGIELMRQLGFDAFDVVGHDRGARVGYRMALAHPQAIRRLTVMDVIPTGEVWARADERFARGYWHWSFLALPHPVPETIIGHDPEFFFLDAHPGSAVGRSTRSLDSDVDLRGWALAGGRGVSLHAPLPRAASFPQVRWDVGR